jgi:glycosyltransferase involved in cell wall biosynthesis
MPVLPELPAISQAPLSVVLLARDNEATVEQTLRGWLGFLNNLKREFEIILVDDGSTDRTLELAKALAASHSQIRIYPHAAPAGIGAALRTAIAVAQFPLLVYSTADRCYSHENLTRCLKAPDKTSAGGKSGFKPSAWDRFRQAFHFGGKPSQEDHRQASAQNQRKAPIDEADLVSGYRVWKTERKPWRWNETIYRWLVRIFFGVRLKDVDCAFKLFRRETFARIPIQSNGSFVHAEILAKANFLGKVIAEDVPINFRDNGKMARPPANYWNRWRDPWRVFFYPDFGPSMLPGADAISSAPSTPVDESTNMS